LGVVSLSETFHGLWYQATGDVRNRDGRALLPEWEGEARQEARYPNNLRHSSLKKFSKTGM